VLELAGVSKDYRALRPLRVHQLEVLPGDSIALMGFDRVSSEVLVNLVTGTTLPDTGRVVVFGRGTADITDAADWLSVVDGFGIVSERAVLLEALTVLQNVAIPLTLDVEPLRDQTRRRAGILADEAGLAQPLWDRPVNTLGAGDKMRVRLGRALALDPKILLLEHVSADLDALDASRLAGSLQASARRRGTAILAATADERFARAVAARVLWWEPASGRLRERRRWFGGRKKLD
jgi:predicted ABC-type transport system involved in lysophospholipase L1 biosynthesis ATPase subunit